MLNPVQCYSVVILNSCYGELLNDQIFNMLSIN